MKPLTNQVIPFPIREVLEKETHGALYRDVMDHATAVSAFLANPAWKSRVVEMSLRERMSASRDKEILLLRMMAATNVMVIARNWIDEAVADDDAITQLGRACANGRLGSGERWWHEENTPQDLQQLCLIAEGLLARVRSAAERLRKAVEASQGEAA